MAKNPQLIDRTCPVRPCVIERELDHCAQCNDYAGCAKLTERLVVYEQVRLRIGAEIPADDRACFITPYENQVRLEALRPSR